MHHVVADQIAPLPDHVQIGRQSIMDCHLLGGHVRVAVRSVEMRRMLERVQPALRVPKDHHRLSNKSAQDRAEARRLAVHCRRALAAKGRLEMDRGAKAVWQMDRGAAALVGEFNLVGLGVGAPRARQPFKRAPHNGAVDLRHGLLRRLSNRFRSRCCGGSR
eukprot:5334724-Pleurochrysis_carterae.AAC.1